MVRTYLVTGGAGFIGTNLVERLVRDGHSVIVVDDLSAGKAERLPELVPLYRLDICKTEPLTALMRGVDVVVHLAALPSVQFSIEHPQEAQRVNVDGTLSVLTAAKTAGVRRVVYAASSAVYGDQDIMPLRELFAPQPKSPYALHKYSGEVMMRLWYDLHQLETVSLRFFNAYGPYLDPEGAYASVIGRFLKQRAQHMPLTITGDGEQTRDFVHVSDIVDAIVRASLSDTVGHGEVLNVGSGVSVSVNTVARLIGGSLSYVAPRIEPRHSQADIGHIKLLLDWRPTISLEQGLAELKKHFGVV
jgi:UDP-glucose 4-epimerase